MTKQTLERLIEMQKAIAICECIINDIVEGYKLQLATPRTEEELSLIHISEPTRH